MILAGATIFLTEGISNAAAVAVVRNMFQRVSGASVERMRERVLGIDAPPVRCTAIYSKTDGVVHWRSCIERRQENTENIEVYGSHCGMAVHPAVLYAIANRLYQSIDAWEPFRSQPTCVSMLYPEPAYAE